MDCTPVRTVFSNTNSRGIVWCQGQPCLKYKEQYYFVECVFAPGCSITIELAYFAVYICLFRFFKNKLSGIPKIKTYMLLKILDVSWDYPELILSFRGVLVLFIVQSVLGIIILLSNMLSWCWSKVEIRSNKESSLNSETQLLDLTSTHGSDNQDEMSTLTERDMKDVRELIGSIRVLEARITKVTETVANVNERLIALEKTCQQSGQVESPLVRHHVRAPSRGRSKVVYPDGYVH